MFDDRFDEAFNSFRANNSNNDAEAREHEAENKKSTKVKKEAKENNKADKSNKSVKVHTVEPSSTQDSPTTESAVKENSSTGLTSKKGYDPYIPSDRKERPQYRSKLTSEDRKSISEANKNLADARASRDDTMKSYMEERKALRAKAKENRHGREETDLFNLSGSDTDIYLDSIIGNSMGFDATGKRTSNATGKELRRVIKKGDKYVFSDDGSDAELFDYQQWQNGEREGEKFEGKGIANRTLSKAIQNIAYKKVLLDLVDRGLSEDDFNKLADALKTKNKKLSSMLGDGDAEYSIAEQNFIDKLYTPIIENGEQETQNRRIFADAWDVAENRAIGDIEQALSRLAVADARKEASHWNAIEREDAEARDKFNSEQAGPKPRTADVYHYTGSDFPYGFNVSGEGASAQYMGRIEEDKDGKKYFRAYSATKQPDSVIDTVKETYGGRLGNKDALWLASYSANTHEKPVFNMPISEGDDISQVVNTAKISLEQNLGQIEGRRDNVPVENAVNDWLGETYIGTSFPDYVAAEFGEDVRDKTRFNRTMLKKRLEQLEQHNLAVDSETFEIVPLGSVENDYLSKLRDIEQAKHDLAMTVSPAEKGYEQQPDGTWLKVYKPDNPMSKGNRQKGDLNIKRNYGAGSTVKDKKTGKYYGETAQEERIKSLDKKPEKPQGLLGTLKRRGH